jgi:hypothetical protein
MSAPLSMRADYIVAIITAIVYSIVIGVLIFAINPTPTMPNAGVADLEKTLIDVNGILLGFAGIMFAQLLAGGQSLRSTVAPAQRDLSNQLLRLPLRGVILVFAYFTFSIVISVLVLTGAETNPTSTTRISDAVGAPLLSMILALLLLGLYLGRYGRTQLSLIQPVA